LAELATKKKNVDRQQALLLKKETALQEYIEESSELSAHARKLTELKRILLMTDMGDMPSDGDEENSEAQFIQKLSAEIQEQKKTVSLSSQQFANEIDTLQKQNKALEQDEKDLEDSLKNVEFLLRTRKQEFEDQQSKFDKLRQEYTTKKEQLDELTSKLTNLNIKQKELDEIIKTIKSEIPQMEKSDGDKRKKLQALNMAQKESEDQINATLEEIKKLYEIVTSGKSAATSEEKKLQEFWTIVEANYRKVAEEISYFKQKPIPQLKL